MALDYKDYEFNIYECLVRLQQELLNSVSCTKTEQWLEEIAAAQDRIKTRRFRVAVVGEFKRGKSSFINALLGQVVLPVDASPATATINRIIYGTVPKAYICYKDGERQEIKIDQLAAYVTKLTAESTENAARIREAIVEFPSIFCQNYVELIDTPGMNDDDSMNEVTVASLSQIDLAIVAISAMLPFSDTECEFVVKLLESQEICQIIFVITYIDAVRDRDRERVLSYLKERICEKVLERLQKKYPEEDPIFQKYRQIFGELNQFAISSLDALDGYEYGNYELLEKSGLPQLNKELPRLILNSQNNSSLEWAMRTIDAVASQYREEQPKLLNICEQKERDLLEKKKMFAEIGYQTAHRLMNEAKEQMFTVLDSFQKDMAKDVRRDFINCLSSVRTPDVNLLSTKLTRQESESKDKIREKINNALNPALHQIYMQEAIKSMTELSRRLCKLLESYDNFAEVTQDLTRLNCWQPKYSESREIFRWTSPLIPSPGELEKIDIITRIEHTLERSLDDYAARRRADAVRQAEDIVSQAEKHIEDIVVKLFCQIEQYQKDLKKQSDRLKAGTDIAQINAIERENSDLREKFRRELTILV